MKINISMISLFSRSQWYHFAIQIVSLIFALHGVSAKANTEFDGEYQFVGHYHDYISENVCRKVPATATLMISNGRAQLTIDAPGANCLPPQFYESGDILRISVLPNYGFYFKTQSDCAYTPGLTGAVYFEPDASTGIVSDPVVFQKNGRWNKTLFEIRSHTLIESCRD